MYTHACFVCIWLFSMFHMPLLMLITKLLKYIFKYKYYLAFYFIDASSSFEDLSIHVTVLLPSKSNLLQATSLYHSWKYRSTKDKM